MNRFALAWPAIFHPGSALVSGPTRARESALAAHGFLLLAVLFLPWPLAAQEASSGEDPGAGEARSAEQQAIDEEEAEFRRRMELEEGDEGALSDPGMLPDIVDVEPFPVPEDGLPPASRDHIEAQLTDLIIENGRWTPEDAERPTPYTPSEAAASDPELAAEEAAAWDEAVAAYHEREREAWVRNGAGAASAGQANASGQGSGTGDGTGDGQGNGQGHGQGSGRGSGAGAGQGNGSAGLPPGGAGQAGDSTERAPEGAPFNALDFLRGQAGEQAGSDGGERDSSGSIGSVTPEAGVAPPTGSIPIDLLEALFGAGSVGRDTDSAPDDRDNGEEEERGAAASTSGDP